MISDNAGATVVIHSRLPRPPTPPGEAKGGGIPSDVLRSPPGTLSFGFLQSARGQMKLGFLDTGGKNNLEQGGKEERDSHVLAVLYLFFTIAL